MVGIEFNCTPGKRGKKNELGGGGGGGKPRRFPHLFLLSPTSSPGRLSLALEVGRPTSKAREKRPSWGRVVFSPQLFFFVNFSPALYYLNAWNSPGIFR